MAYSRFVRWLALPAIAAHASLSSLKVDRLLKAALVLKAGFISDLQFEAQLKRYFATCLPGVYEELNLAERRRALLESPHPYKVALVRAGDSEADHPSLWQRRLAVVRGLGVRLDLMTLTAGAEIEPHGHSAVVSGFLVLEGEVRGRTFDRLDARPGRWLVRKSFDQLMRQGAFLTSAEWSSNIHWLNGIAGRSFLLRVTVSGFPTRRFDSNFQSERVHIDLLACPNGCEPFWARVSEEPGSE